MGEIEKKDIDVSAHNVLDDLLDSKNKQIELLATTIPIYILGHHKTQLKEMQSIQEKIKAAKFEAKLVVEHEDRDFLPDFEKEKVILEHGGIIVILDGKIGAVVGESAYLMSCSELLTKCILMVPKENKDKILSRKEHYLYYLIKYVYESIEELVNAAAGLAIQMAHLWAIIEINKKNRKK